MDSVRSERRREVRDVKALPVDLGGMTAVTQNISASGMYFEAETPYAVGSEVQFSLDLQTPEGKRLLKCRGEIVRIRPQSGRMGMAVKIIESAMVSGQS